MYIWNYCVSDGSDHSLLSTPLGMSMQRCGRFRRLILLIQLILRVFGTVYTDTKPLSAAVDGKRQGKRNLNARECRLGFLCSQFTRLCMQLRIGFSAHSFGAKSLHGSAMLVFIELTCLFVQAACLESAPQLNLILFIFWVITVCPVSDSIHSLHVYREEGSASKAAKRKLSLQELSQPETRMKISEKIHKRLASDSTQNDTAVVTTNSAVSSARTQ